ncbi:urease accessory protein UreF [Gilvimarinus chinensis]|uniref:urease accessory protein UreF n=1 Tax=Gilvimarinus chinensis TaxID=396005 RepID=UPI000365A0EC|nr:urease accessory UreF family protein [Gilvimarinus chinensis]
MVQASLLHLLHLVSPALPVGAYAYSQGLEYAVEEGWLDDEGALADWLENVMGQSLAYLDVPVLRRCYLAWQDADLAAVNHWNHLTRACRETSELLLEDEQLGQALNRLLNSLQVPDSDPALYETTPCFASQFALAGVHWQVDIDELAQGFVWSWLENQVAAATKIVPLGQTHAQQLLTQLMPAVLDTCERAKTVTDDEIGLSLPGLAMASCLHERQYTRLFRS